MQISESGIEFVKDFEQLRLKAYKPTIDDVWTIGYGSTRGVYQGMVITPFEADQMLQKDLMRAVSCVNFSVFAKLTQDQFDALCSLVFNIGCPAWTKSTARDDLNRGDIMGFLDQAFSEERGWTKQAGKTLPGLVRRRAAEQRLFEGQ